MNKLLKSLFSFASALCAVCFSLAATGCSRGADKTIYVCASGVPHAEVLRGAVKAELEKKGYKVNVLLKGLGEYPAIQELFIQHVKFATKHQREDITVKKKKYEKTDDID